MLAGGVLPQPLLGVARRRRRCPPRRLSRLRPCPPRRRRFRRVLPRRRRSRRVPPNRRRSHPAPPNRRRFRRVLPRRRRPGRRLRQSIPHPRSFRRPPSYPPRPTCRLRPRFPPRPTFQLLPTCRLRPWFRRRPSCPRYRMAIRRRFLSVCSTTRNSQPSRSRATQQSPAVAVQIRRSASFWCLLARRRVLRRRRAVMGLCQGNENLFKKDQPTLASPGAWPPPCLTQRPTSTPAVHVL